jgi:hypothetical protein
MGWWEGICLAFCVLACDPTMRATCHTTHKQDRSLSPSTWLHLLSNTCCAHAGSCEVMESCGKGECMGALLLYAGEDTRCHADRSLACFRRESLLPLSACTHAVPLHTRPTHPRTSDGVCCRSRVMKHRVARQQQFVFVARGVCRR